MACPGAEAHPRPSEATTSRPTRSPVRTWCSASAAAARTVRSRVLAAPSMPPETPMSRRPSTTSHTPASCSARVVITCSSPVRSETGQLIRLSRSPVAKRRIPSNSVPLPIRRDRCRPTRPSGCGTSARLSYGAVCGSTLNPCSGMSTGPQRQPAQALVSATRSAPMTRRPHRRGLNSSVGQAVAHQRPHGAGRRLVATCGAGAATRVTCSTPVRSSTTSREVVPWPSWSRWWSIWVRRRGRAARSREQPHHGQHDERGGQHDQHLQAHHDAAGEAAEREQAGPDERRRRPPGGHRRDSSVRGVVHRRQHGVDDARARGLGHPEVRLDGDPVRQHRPRHDLDVLGHDVVAAPDRGPGASGQHQAEAAAGRGAGQHVGVRAGGGDQVHAVAPDRLVDRHPLDGGLHARPARRRR